MKYNAVLLLNFTDNIGDKSLNAKKNGAIDHDL